MDIFSYEYVYENEQDQKLYMLQQKQTPVVQRSIDIKDSPTIFQQHSQPICSEYVLYPQPNQPCLTKYKDCVF
jgi:hypothetical protein